MPGCEEIAWLEIREHRPGAKLVDRLFVKDQNGIVLWSDAAGSAGLLTLRTTEDVFALALPLTQLSRDWKDLRMVADLLHHSTMLHEAVNLKFGGRKQLAYRVISRKSGDHQYRRKDLEEACIKGIERRTRERWQLVDDNSDIEIWANVIGSTFLCGVRLSDRTMRHRPYQVVSLPASLRPSVAAAMVWLTNPQPQEIFVDPMCGSGTILAERILAAPYQKVQGGDIAPQSVEASIKNLETLDKPFTVQKWDACKLPLDAASVHKVSTNLPFGKQIGSPEAIRRLYPCFFKELSRVLLPGGIATVLSSEYDLVKNTIRQQPALEIMTGYSIAVLGEWGRLYIIKKS
jgi:23S rRNA G2445 N2-methylase RlmL